MATELISRSVDSGVTAATLLDRLDLERLEISSRTAADPERRAGLGQFFTPASVARFMAGMLRVSEPPREFRLLDAGGGSGMLTAAVVAALCARPTSRWPDALNATVWEIDDRLVADIGRTFEHCRGVCDAAGIRFTGTLRQENFVLAAPRLIHNGGLFRINDGPRFHAAILNPPYRKLWSESAEREGMRSVGIETSNLYSAFVLCPADGSATAVELVRRVQSGVSGDYPATVRAELNAVRNKERRECHEQQSDPEYPLKVEGRAPAEW